MQVFFYVAAQGDSWSCVAVAVIAQVTKALTSPPPPLFSSFFLIKLWRLLKRGGYASCVSAVFT